MDVVSCMESTRTLRAAPKPPACTSLAVLLA